jgi:hypothetical protein
VQNVAGDDAAIKSPQKSVATLQFVGVGFGRIGQAINTAQKSNTKFMQQRATRSVQGHCDGRFLGL